MRRPRIIYLIALPDTQGYILDIAQERIRNLNRSGFRRYAGRISVIRWDGQKPLLDYAGEGVLVYVTKDVMEQATTKLDAAKRWRDDWETVLAERHPLWERNATSLVRLYLCRHNRRVTAN